MRKGMTVGELADRLREYPAYYEVVVEVLVGGDLVTDRSDLVAVRETGESSGNYVVLVPAPDEYDVRNLIDEGLRARAEKAATR